MLTFEIARAFIFDEAKITAFLKIINKMFVMHDIIEN